MIRKHRAASAIVGCALVAAIFTLATCALSRPVAIPANENSNASPAPIPPAPAFPAMSYYDDNCSRCHGPQGSFYGPTLGKALDDAHLVKVVNDMADGPGGAPLQPDGLAAETAFHRALILHTPFLSLTTNADGKLSGEVMSGASVALLADGTKTSATVDGSTWTAQLPAAVKLSNVQIIAELAGKMTVLRPARETYSHAAPLWPPDKR